MSENGIMNQNDNKEKQKMFTKKRLGIFIAVVIALITLACGITLYLHSDSRQLQRQLDLGQKYLEEHDYEQAVVEFTKAIEIDSMNVEAYLGLAEAYEGMGDDAMAVEILEKGYELTGDERLLKALQVINANMVTADDCVEIEADSDDKPKAMSEEELKGILASTVSEPILNFIYDDFDYNGTYEAVAFCGEAFLDEEYPEFGTYSGTLYFVTENGVKVIRENNDYWNSGDVFDFGNAKIFYIYEYSGTGNLSFLYQIDGNEIVEVAGSGKGHYFSQDEAGRICMTDSQYDASVNGTGHTWNVYYFYWDNGLHEYGGTWMSKDAFLSYSGTDSIIQRISEDGNDISSICKRQNGIININCCDGTKNRNVRVVLENETVTVVPVDEGYFYEVGIIKQALIPEIATYPESDSEANAYRAYDVIINRYKTACSVDSDDWESNAGNYVDLDQYVLESYHTASHYDEDFGDESYEIVYYYYDIDKNGILELILVVEHHEPCVFEIYAFDGERAVGLGMIKQSRYGWYNFYENGVIEASNGYGDTKYYKFNDDGYSLQQITVSFDEIRGLKNFYSPLGLHRIVLAEDVPAE